MKAKDGIIIALAAFVLGLSFPHLKTWFLAESDAAADSFSPKPRITMPKQGVAADHFTHALLQAALQAGNESNILLAPNSLAGVLLQMQPMANEELAAKLQSLQLPQTFQESAAAAHEAACLFADDAAKLNAPFKNDSVFPAPFSHDLPKALSLVNETIESFTQGDIAQVASSDLTPAETSLISINALSFDTPWLYPPLHQETTDEDFFNADGSFQRLRMMHCKGCFKVIEDPKGHWKAAALFFKNSSPVKAPRDSSCMVVILPKGDNARQLAETLSAEDISALRTTLAQASEKEGVIELPRLIFQPMVRDITPILRLLGIDPLFTSTTPLQGLSGAAPLPFTRALQACSITLNENGTISGTASPPAPAASQTLLRLNRPFIWFIGSLTSPAPPYALGVIQNL